MSGVISIDSGEGDCVHTELLGVSKVAINKNNAQHRQQRRYGSTSTFSTEYNTSSSSSSSASSTQDDIIASHNDRNQFQHLSLDLTSIDNSDSSEERTALHSRESSYSDISTDGAGYYNRYATHRQRTYDACRFIENYMFTMNNFKVIFSFICWYGCYMIMGVFGGSVAYMHFERSDSTNPDPLPDFGYEVIPVSEDICTEFSFSFCVTKSFIFCDHFLTHSLSCMCIYQPKQTVFLSCHPTCAPRKCPKYSIIHPLRTDIIRGSPSLEATLSSKNWPSHLGWRWSSHSPTFVPFELSSLSQPYHHCWINGDATAESEVCRSTAFTCNIWKCT